MRASEPIYGMLRHIIKRFPITAFILVCFIITWTIWFSIPGFSGDNWILIKIWVGVGIVPGLTAVFLDRFRNGWNDQDFNRRWWVTFSCVAVTVTLLLIWSLSDIGVSRGISSSEIQAPGLSFKGLIATLISAVTSGFVFATARSSKTKSMSSISYLRTKPVWLLSALFIPALLCGISVGISMLLGIRSFKLPLADESWRVWPYLLGSFLISFCCDSGGRNWLAWVPFTRTPTPVQSTDLDFDIGFDLESVAFASLFYRIV